MPEFDGRGLALSTSPEAAALYRVGMDLLLAAWPGAGEVFDEVIAADPGFALALAARARLHAARAEPERARAAIVAAGRAVQVRGDPRERSHVEVLACAIEGRSGQARSAALAHLDAWPRDALVLSLLLGAFRLFAFSGMADHDQAKASLCDRLADAYDADDWWFLTFRGWSHVENGDGRLGRPMVERAFGLRPDNANAAHALSHALFEDGACRQADAFIAGWLPGYDRSGQLYSHIAWHRALAALDEGDGERALDIYRDAVRPAVNEAAPLNVLSDSASFLWRMQAYGHEIAPDLWGEAASYGRRAFPRPGLPFVDVHLALAAAATGDEEAFEDRLLALGNAGSAHPWTPVVTAIGAALRDFANADYAGCVRSLEPAMGDLSRMGGSHAQREVIEDTLLIALIRDGQTSKARSWLDARLHRRPSPRDSRWRAGLG